MAKIRGVKPDLWTDDDFVEASAHARLLFIGLWNFACDNGHLQDKSKQIKMRVLPTDDVNCAELLRELHGLELIERDEGWITVPNLTRHQKIDKRFFTTCEKPGCIKPDSDSQPETRRAHDETTTGARREHGVGTAGARGDGDGDGDGDGELNGSDGEGSVRETSRKRSDAATVIPNDFAIDDDRRQWAKTNAPFADVDRETEKFVDYWQARSGAAARKKDWFATWRNWLRKASDDTPNWKRNVHHLPGPADEGASWMRGGA